MSLNEKFCVIIFIYYCCIFDTGKQNKIVFASPISTSLPPSITKINCTEELPVVSKALDWILDHLPPIQWPSYNYLGPGTRLEENVKNNIEPTNPLDAAAKIHDQIYVQYKDLCHRHLADKYLENEAWKRVTAKDASLGEKIPAWITTNICRSGATGQDSFLPGEVIINQNQEGGDHFVAFDYEPDVNLNLQSLQTVHNLLQMRNQSSYIIEASEPEIINLVTSGMIREAQVVPLNTLLEVYDTTKEDRTFHPGIPSNVQTTWSEEGTDDDTQNSASMMQENINDGQIASIEEENFDDGQTEPMMVENIDDGQTGSVMMAENINDGQTTFIVSDENINRGQTDVVNSNLIGTSIILPETAVLHESFPENIFQRSAVIQTNHPTIPFERKLNANASRKINFKTARASSTNVNIPQKKTAISTVNNNSKNHVSTVDKLFSSLPSSTPNGAPSLEPNAVSEHRPPNKITLGLTGGKGSDKLSGDFQKRSSFKEEQGGRADIIDTDEVDSLSESSSESSLFASNKTTSVAELFPSTTEPSIPSDDTPHIDTTGAADLIINYLHRKMFPINNEWSARETTHYLPNDPGDSPPQPVYVYEKVSVILLNEESRLPSPSQFENKTWFVRPIMIDAVAASPDDEDILSASVPPNVHSTKSTGYHSHRNPNFKRRCHTSGTHQPEPLRQLTSSLSSPFYRKPSLGQPSTQLRFEKPSVRPAKKCSCFNVNFDDSAFVPSPANERDQSLNVGDEGDDNAYFIYDGGYRSNNCKKQLKVRESNNRLDRSYSTLPINRFNDHLLPGQTERNRRIKDSRISRITIPNKHNVESHAHQLPCLSSNTRRKHNRPITKGRPKSSLRQGHHERYLKRKGSKKMSLDDLMHVD